MERLLSLYLLLVVGMSQVSRAALPFGGQPDVGITVDVQEVLLPNAAPIGQYVGEAHVNALVEADCPHSIGVAFDGFVNDDSQAVYTEKMSMQVNSGAILAPGKMEELFGSNQPTPSGGATLPLTLTFRVDDLTRFPAGRYRCTISLTIMVLP